MCSAQSAQLSEWRLLSLCAELAVSIRTRTPHPRRVHEAESFFRHSTDGVLCSVASWGRRDVLRTVRTASSLEILAFCVEVALYSLARTPHPRRVLEAGSCYCHSPHGVLCSVGSRARCNVLCAVRTTPNMDIIGPLRRIGSLQPNSHAATMPRIQS